MVALLTLIITLGIRFISQRNVNQQNTLNFAAHSVNVLDNVLLPLEKGRNPLLALVGAPCSQAHLVLRKQAASLQTVRSIALVKDGILYCSSIFGNRDVPLREIQPALPSAETKLVLSTDKSLLKGSPILIQWYPVSDSGEDGVMQIVNIDLITRLMLEPQRPLITDVALTVGDKYLRYGENVSDSLTINDDERVLRQQSSHFPVHHYRQWPGSQRAGVDIFALSAAAGADAQSPDGLRRLACDREPHEFYGKLTLARPRVNSSCFASRC